MSNEQWLRHIEEVSCVVRPEHGGDVTVWMRAVLGHEESGCSDCHEHHRALNLRKVRSEWARENRLSARSWAVLNNLGSK
jgi:hypothetical protein